MALWRAKDKPPVELVVANLVIVIVIAAFFLMLGYMLEKKIAKQIDKKKGKWKRKK